VATTLSVKFAPAAEALNAPVAFDQLMGRLPRATALRESAERRGAVRTVAEWLALLGLSEYAPRFSANKIDFSVLQDLTDRDLTELGVPLGHRRKILRAIAELYSVSPQGPSTAIEMDRGDSVEKRQLTLMFCDLVDSTALSEGLDPDDMHDVMRAYQAACSRVILSYDGLVSRFVGDGILPCFGFPRAHEDDAVRAIRAGLEIVSVVSELQTPSPEPLQVHIGIATGVVVIGDLIGEHATKEQAVVGETPNLAARLQRLAQPGTLVISSDTRRLASGHFNYRDLGHLPIKGLVKPAQAWQVLGASGVESRFEAEHGTALTPLLGRDEEIDLLLRRWRQAKQSEGRVVLLTGEPGIGKSHIALTLQERIEAEPYTRLRYFCSAHYTNSALFPFMSQLETAARFERNDSPGEKYSKLERLLAQSAVDLGRSVALVANLLSLPPSERYRLPDMSPQRRKEMTLSTLVGQLDGLASRQPVLMVFEDAHWVDPTSLELLSLIVQRAPQLPVLLLITARPEFRPPWPGHAHVTTVPLTRLDRRCGAALVERVATGKRLPEEVMDQILARTDGVPLFVEELTKMVLESGFLQERENHYELDRPLPSLAIPTTLHASLTARLDRLPAAVREVAQIGAAVGREFSYELLNAVAELRLGNLDDALGQLTRSELVFCRGEIPHAVFTFKHALVRDAAYAGLLKSQRAQLHAAIASALEQHFPEIVEAEPETLAHHLTEAGLTETAIEHWLRAGRKAAARSANLEASAHLRRGIEVVSRLPDDPGRDRLELDLQFALGPCLIASQGPASSPALTTFSRARELCERLGDLPEYLQVMFWFATASVVRGELPQALEAIATLLGRAEARGDRPALINAIRGRAMILLFMGHVVDAHHETERAVEMFAASSESERLAARTAGQDAGAAALALMSWTLWILGRADQAVARITAGLQRADAVEHPHTQAYVCYYSSVLYALRGEPAVAHRHAERCRILSEEHGFRQWRGLSRALRGISLTLLDPLSNTLDDVREALGEYRGAGYQLGITALDVLFAEALLLRKEPEAALDMIEQGLATASRNNERIFEAELYRLKARALLARDGARAWKESESSLDQALRTARNQQARSFELRAARDLAALWTDQGKRVEALKLLAPVLAGFSEGFDTQDLKEAKALLDQPR
jgi:class 3 adenylate cyclase/predicted ATPase